MSKILWLTDGNYSAGQKALQNKLLATQGIKANQVFYFAAAGKCGALLRPKNKTVEPRWDKQGDVKSAVDEMIDMVAPKILVCHDWATLCLLTDDTNSIDQRRGSVYRYRNLPLIVTFPGYYIHRTPEGGFLLNLDMRKMKRWMDDEQHIEPEFVYSIVRTRENIEQLRRDMLSAKYIAEDLETAGAGGISCAGFAGLMPDGTIRCWVLPFMNPTKPDACHFENAEDEAFAWQVFREINASDIPKAMHNGSYDCAYMLAHHVPPKNYILDSAVMMHSMWVKAGKRLFEVSSYFLDYCRYWKDEMKGDKKTRDRNERVPSDPKQLEMYWRYCALDCYNTLLNCFKLLPMLTRTPWALENYRQRMLLQNGVALAGSMRGMLIDDVRYEKKVGRWQNAAEQELSTLRKMADDPEFNPGSSAQLGNLLYDVLGAQAIGKRGGKTKNADRSTDEKVLKRIRLQHPLLARVIDQVWAAKKPANLVSKYGDKYKLGLNGRFLYHLSATGTETSRFSSNNHQFWVGTNAQNIPESSRDIFVADRDYVFFEIDYSQSDSYFVAWECGDERMIANLLDPRDTHCLHAEFFFKRDYDEIYKGYKAKADWVVHPLNGVRQNTKRVCHGANYDMQGETLFYQSMGREAVVGTAIAIGYADAANWSDKKLIALVCEPLLNAYFDMYPGLARWKHEVIERVVKNGNVATAAHGFSSLFFGNIKTDAKIQRELFAFYGQAGTSGNINRSLIELRWRDQIEQKYNCYFITQTHDSLLWMLHKDSFHESADHIKRVMEKEFALNGRPLSVPTEAKIAMSWGKAMGDYSDSLTWAELENREELWMQKEYGR